MNKRHRLSTTNLLNLSFEHSILPVKFKTAYVTPLLKKHVLDVSDPANYQPISNLNTISKILERLILIRLVLHASTSSNFDAVQSAYRRLHSTETALLKITDDIFAGFDNHQSTILVLISRRHSTASTMKRLSAGLNTRLEWREVHSIGSVHTWKLDRRLCVGNKTRPTCFLWILAYLKDHRLDRLFFRCTSHRCQAIVNSFGVSHHQYTDDTQIYIAVSRADVSDKVDLLQDCTAGIHSWLHGL